jgi:hypothetical protein
MEESTTLEVKRKNTSKYLLRLQETETIYFCCNWIRIAGESYAVTHQFHPICHLPQAGWLEGPAVPLIQELKKTQTKICPLQVEITHM